MCTSARWRNDIYNDSDFLARGSLEQYINPPKKDQSFIRRSGGLALLRARKISATLFPFSFLLQSEKISII